MTTPSDIANVVVLEMERQSARRTLAGDFIRLRQASRDLAMAVRAEVKRLVERSR